MFREEILHAKFKILAFNVEFREEKQPHSVTPEVLALIPAMSRRHFMLSERLFTLG